MTETASWPRRIWRNLYWWREDRRTRAAYRDVRHVVYFGSTGIGDELLLSAPLHELRQRGTSGLCVLTSRRDLFDHSPDVDFARPVDYADLAFLPRIGVRVSHTNYIDEHRAPDIDVPPAAHLIADMCRRCGLSGNVILRPWFWLNDAERAASERWHGCIAVQSSRVSASMAIGNKEWLPARFQAVISTLASRHRIVQLGLCEDPPFVGAEDMRGRTTLRETATILAGARAFIGLVGFLMHLARSVDCPAVILYGGREHPDQSGYSCNENLYSAVPCAPCWRWNSCDYDHRCMTMIEPADVLAAVDRLFARPRAPLAVARHTLP